MCSNGDAWSNEETDLIDELANVVMDIIRPMVGLSEDGNSDKDDELYHRIHTALKETYKELTK